jgi:hypothetical protein
VKSDILVIIAHPDDEIFVSGTLCLLSENGRAMAPVRIIDGEVAHASYCGMNKLHCWPRTGNRRYERIIVTELGSSARLYRVARV